MISAAKRTEAAKKAWRTRRRLAKPTPAMRRVLQFLVDYRDVRVAELHHGAWCYSVWYAGIHSSPIHPPPITLSIQRALKRRRWLERVGRHDTGGTMGTLPDGTDGIVEPSFNIEYRITDKARAILASLTRLPT